MEVIGESALSAALQVVFGKLASPELLKFAGQKEIIAELQNWKKELMMINDVLEEAEEKQITKLSVKNWLDDLRDLAYDIEDVLDEFATEQPLRRSLKAKGADQVATTSKVRSIIPTFYPDGEVTFNTGMGSKIKEVTKRLDDISTRKAKLGFYMVPGVEKSRERFASGAASTWQRPPSTSLINEAVYGRDDDKEVIIEMLLKNEAGESNFGVIPIVGIGGMGKTTLVQLIYRDYKIMKHFDSRAWVCVSDESDIVKLTKMILNAVSPDEIRDGDDFNQVQLKLSKILVGKRFLLVLDDVWNINNYEQWNHLETPFNSGARGSKIVVTTRHTKVAQWMRPDSYHHLLERLSNDDCWNVFVKHAFQNKNADQHPNLKLIQRISDKCSGLPLAAKVLGGLLRSKPRDLWEHVLSSKIWNKSGVIPVLRLSYQHLPSHLKRCFAYCALFPRDYEFKRKELILLWMAEGLIHQVEEDNRQLEVLGDDYFDELLSRCFFQPSSDSKSQFKMHDLINDLAQDVATEICFNLENIDKISKRTRHSSFVRGEYDVFKKFEALNKLEQLRTFVALPVMVNDNKKCYLSTKVLHDLLPKLRKLRVLSLSGYEINELPDSIGDMKHLRYLNLSHTKLKWLPETVTGLYNLQSLILCNCVKLIKLPTGIINLINLRHLDISGSTMLEEMPPQVGNLINLQTLFRFSLSKGNGSRIKELKNLLNLQGELAISGLENVLDPRDAMYANLKGRPNIECLCMVWSKDFGNSRNESAEVEVLKRLQPHQSLKTLGIGFYGGSIFPRWVGDPSFSKLVSMVLYNCKNCTSLPALGGLPFLKDLAIEGMNQVTSIGHGFYGETANPFRSIKSLRFENMVEWKDWLTPKLVEETLVLFPCLGKLTIIKCPSLINLPDELPSLVTLRVEECQELEISIPRLPLLTQLFVWRIPRLSCLWKGLAQPLIALEDLEINQCDDLACLRKHGSGLENLGCLRRLWILGCDGVVSLEEQGLPCNLSILAVKGCSNLEKLPNALHTLTSLKDLTIENCPKLVSFPETGLPPMLRRLWVRNCEGLETLPDGMMINSCALEYLEIKDCPLIEFPIGELPATLKTLLIEDCPKLESLPEGIMHHPSIDSNNTSHLKFLRVWGCPFLKSIPRGDFPSTLETLSIWDCEQLESIPGNMLQNLISLRILSICNCPDVVSSPEAFLNPNLKHLSMSDCENMRWPVSGWGLHTLTSLDELYIKGPFPDLLSFSGSHLLFPTSLTTLRLGNLHNLKSIASTALQSLISLKTLELYSCPKLRSFVPKEGLPPTLERLEIRRWPILKTRCLKDKGKDWPKLAHIPYVEIDYIVQQ